MVGLFSSPFQALRNDGPTDEAVHDENFKISENRQFQEAVFILIAIIDGAAVVAALVWWPVDTNRLYGSMAGLIREPAFSPTAV